MDGHEKAATFASDIGARKISLTKDGEPTCNASDYAQVPDHPRFFIGRIRQGALSGNCSGGDWTLALFEMNPAGDNISFVRSILDLPSPISDNGMLSGALDPSITKFNQRLWISFECHVSYGKKPGVKSCAGPFDFEKGIDAAHVSVIANDRDIYPHEPNYYAALVPKIFSFEGKMYMYWDAVQIERKTGKWQSITTRGAQLKIDRNGLISVIGSNGAPIAAADPNLTVEVLGVDPNDPRSDRIADTFGVFPTKKNIFVTAALGGTDRDSKNYCFKPSSPVEGCYRLSLFSTSSPLVPHTLNQHPVTPKLLDDHDLPANSGEYTRIVTGESGQLFLMGKYHAASTTAGRGSFLPEGYWRYPIELTNSKPGKQRSIFNRHRLNSNH
ncbi:MAG TPA: hypothetical protein VIM56_07970 [Rhizomicrobium sp.]